MRPFQLGSDMKTMRGTFYPTGWMVLLFPGEQQVREAARKLADAGVGEDRMMLMTPQDFRAEVAGSKGDEGILPSAGTEGDTVRKMAGLVAQGHHGLFIHAPDQEQSDHVMEILRDTPVSFGQKYRKLVIEDIVE
ncbi:RNA-binding protein [Ramlibacter alkalitolerans]|uniref:RNA-binding protein n=1 Tax=Ramlibacter alkalitolerans TaxID=2039631 RepID=A0ABS1JX59_9BURK|nr:RNA-binding protein [Ramlibacter alkalitolerans]MBL0428777.1 RNA-binding protein [Ramlibacter alkalitolerans]